MITSGPPIEQIKEAMRATWMAGDFGVVAKTAQGAAEAFVRHLAIRPGMRVLDVACGTGNSAIELARRGGVVTGVDIASNLLAQARERFVAEGVRARFDEGDAEQLPYRDESFDVVVSMFGAMFAPRPRMVVREAARVLEPGGTLAMANWNPESFTAKMFRVGSRYLPPPEGLEPPVLWGDEVVVRRRLAPCFVEIQTEVIETDFDLPMNPAGVVAFFRQHFGPTKTAFQRLSKDAGAAYARDLEELWSNANVATDPECHTLVKNEYLGVFAMRRSE
jgi:SAM-dependent methyltransferase